MNHSAEYFDDVIDFGNLYKGLKKSCRNVRWKNSIVGYENNGLKNTHELRKDLLNGKYKIQKYQNFVVYEPKKRDIIATRIRDRQFQRSLCDNGLYDDFTEHFINDNVACQKGKGTDYAFKRMKTHLQRFYRKHGKDGYVLKCDIHHFFPSTTHSIAKAAVGKYITDDRAKAEVCRVIDSFGGDTGIGLGSQISQLVELSVLNDLDHFIKEKLRIRYYIRYMDDFILMHPDKEYLKYCWEQIKLKLSEIGLELNHKTDLHSLSQGIKFLSWKFMLSDTGKVIVLFDRAKIKRERNRLKRLLRKEADGEVPHGTALTSLESWLANAKRGNTYTIRKNMVSYYNKTLEVTYDERHISRDETARVKCKQCS